MVFPVKLQLTIFILNISWQVELSQYVYIVIIHVSNVKKTHCFLCAIRTQFLFPRRHAIFQEIRFLFSTVLYVYDIVVHYFCTVVYSAWQVYLHRPSSSTPEITGMHPKRHIHFHDVIKLLTYKIFPFSNNLLIRELQRWMPPANSITIWTLSKTKD